MSSAPVGALLAIEFSQRAGSIALRPEPGAPAMERPVSPATDAQDHLLATIDALCRDQAIMPAQLRAIIVSTGPGGFTGLRIACATAKAIVEATGAHLVAVPSALVAARTLAREGAIGDGVATVALAAKGDTAWCEVLRISGGMPEAVQAGLFAGAEFTLGSPPLICDDHLPESWLRACAVVCSAPLLARWSALACLELGESLLASGKTVDPLLLAPVYPRAPEAVTLWDARAAISQKLSPGRTLR